jgi:dienelactone hydrolase
LDGRFQIDYQGVDRAIIIGKQSRKRPAPLRIFFAILAFLALPAQMVLAETGEFRREIIEIRGGDGKTITAQYLRPAGSGPFPAVVALHGCGGLGREANQISERYADWARLLLGRGYAVIFPDSYGSRGLGAQCVVRDRAVRAHAERVGDAEAAKAYLQTQPDIRNDQISLIGWANGGTAALWTIGGKRSGASPNAMPDFRRAVMFYPGCRAIADAAERKTWSPRMKVLILAGEKDTWTPISQCQRVGNSLSEARDDFQLIAYPEAFHEFDHPSREKAIAKGLAFTDDGSGEATVATEPGARDDALRKVPEFLEAR